MRTLAIGLVIAGLAVAVLVALERGLDLVGLVLLGLVAGAGALAIAVATRSGADHVQPATCAECGGVISRNAPYCKHCGAQAS